MTVPQPPDRAGQSQPHVPATFLAAGGRPGKDDRRGWSLAALTGPAAAPPGAAPEWTGSPMRLPSTSPARAGRRRAARLPGPASPPAPGRRGARTRPGAAEDDPVRAVIASAATTESGPAKGGTSAGTPQPAGGPSRDKVRTPPVLPAEDRSRLLDGTHPDPHGCLGAHLTSDGGLCFRTLRPRAQAVTVLTLDGELRARLRGEGDGFFAGEVAAPGGEIPAYELLVQYGEQPGEDDVRVTDPYALPPAVGGFDLRLIGEGRHEHLWRALGARTMTHCGAAGTRFTVWAPNARGVRVAGDFNEWDGTACPMRSLESGVWELFLPGVEGGAVYKFEVVRDDGSRVLHADPMARAAEVPPANGSVVHTSTHRWRDGDWLDRRGAGKPHSAPVSLYELHLPSWRPGLTYRELADQLPAYVRDLGFTHVELMPCAEHPFDGSWGYQVTGFFAPTARLGGPDDFKYLIDALHRAGIGVIMDWVPAHFPKDEWALARFDSTSLYERTASSTEGRSGEERREFDVARPQVRNFLVANALYWCEEFHVDGLRVDALGSMLRADSSTASDEPDGPDSSHGSGNPDAVALLQEVNATVQRRCPGVITAAEGAATWDGVTRATNHPGESGFGGLGFSFEWNTGWMHDSLGYASREPAHRPHHHEQLTFSMAHAYSESYILPVPHDEVGRGKGSLVSRMPGDWWEQRATHRAYLGFMWAHPGKQLLFMGQEFAQRTECTQERGPDWWLLDPSYDGAADHRGVRDLVRDLNAEYLRSAALWQQDTDPAGFSWIEDGSSAADAAAGESVFAFLRFDAEGGPLLAVSNFSSVPLHGRRLGVPLTGAYWREVLNTDDVRYGGSGVHNPAPLPAENHPANGRPASLAPTLPALATVWLRPSAQLG